jgi:hypothetical protein
MIAGGFTAPGVTAGRALAGCPAVKGRIIGAAGIDATATGRTVAPGWSERISATSSPLGFVA